SAINGALLDGGSNSLVQGSANSPIRGHYVFPVRNGAAPTGGTLQGTVRDDSTTPNPVAGASIQVCDSTGACHITNTNGAGMYSVAGLSDGTYTVTVSPPAGGLAQAAVGPFNLVNGATVQADVQLHSVVRIPSDTSLSHHSINPDGTLVLDGRVSNTLTTHGCTDGGADVTIAATNSQTHAQETRSYSLTETPLSSGIYTGTIPPLTPLTGAATVTVSIVCPPPTRGRTFSFSVYIDPSGIVVDESGNPVAGATVTLLRSDSISGPFTPVPAGDTVMSPANRNNPDLTTADGRFGWDVLTGYYIVQASRDGCTAPGNPAQTVVQSAVFPVPPPVANLTLTLSCQTSTATVLSSSANPAAYGTVVTFTATVTATNAGLPNPTTGDGSVSFKDGSSLLCNAVTLGGNQASCSVGLAVGTHAIQATYSGTGRFVASAAALSEQVNPAPTNTALASTPNPSFVNRPITLTATVTSAAPGGSNPTSEGSVSFLLGTATIGSAPLDASGKASIVTSGLPIGHDSLAAVYSGDANFTGSTSLALVQAVQNNRIVFSSNRDGNYEIYAMNPDGTGQVRLTTNPAVDTNPAFSPDGTRIAFVSNRSSGWQIWVMNADGTNAKRVTPSGSDASVTPSWSPDGQRIAYSSTQSGNLQIWVVNADGTNAKRLTSDRAADTSPAWSPSGSLIAFSSTLSGAPQIWVMNADGTNVRRLTSDTTSDVTPAWAPDGSRIAFTTAQRNFTAAIYVMNADGSNVVRLTNNGLAIDATPSWSPDGSQVAFSTTIGNRIEVYVIKVDGSAQTPLTLGPPVNALPEWCCTQAP
ncbi:MAG: Ig-like domain repeat protein, partial [Candidatus Dormibacteraeota bacterium]|nr:Ig-like domain repeat protein [Candidatus Dormibacteraeota bacterium]